MMVLLIDAAARKRIKECVEHAMKNRYPHDKIKKIVDGVLPPAGRDPKHCVRLHQGFKVVFSIDELKPDLWVRRISVSVVKKGIYPDPHAMKMILPEFGFIANFDVENNTATGLNVRLERNVEAIIVGEIMVEPESKTKH